MNADYPPMTLREFSAAMESLSSYVFRNLGLSEPRLSDETIAKMYIDSKGVLLEAKPAADPKTITVVIWSDRHTDPTVHLFTDRAAAEKWARKNGRDSDRHDAYSEETHSGGELFIRYSVESDHLRVFDAVIDEELSES